MKIDEISLDINTSIDKSLNKISSLISRFENLKSSSQNVSNAMKKISDTISPTTDKLNDLSKTAEKTGNDISKNLNITPKMNYMDYSKQLDLLKDKYNNLNRQIKIMEETGVGLTNKFTETDPSKIFSYDTSDIPRLKQELESLQNDINKTKGYMEAAFAKKPESGLRPVQEDVNELNEDLSETPNNVSKISNSFKSLSSIGNKLKNIVSNISKKFSDFTKRATKNTNSFYYQLKKLGLGLLSVRTAMSFLTKAVSAYLSFDGALQDSITNSWNMLGSLLSPAIEVVANLFATATTYVYNFIKALTGIDLVAKANAKALEYQAKSTNKASSAAQRGLSAMDEITNLPTEPSSGAGDIPQITVPQIETSDLFSNLINAIKNGDWYGVGSIIADGINTALGSIPWGKIQSTASKVGIGLAQILNGLVDNLNWTLLGTTIGNGIETAIDFSYSFITTFHWSTFGKGLADSFTGIFTSIDWVKLGKTIHDGLMGIMVTADEFIKGVDWSDLGSKLSEFIDNIDFSDLALRFFNLMMDAFQGFEDFLNELIGKPWTNVLEGLIFAITTVGIASKIGKLKKSFEEFGETLTWITESSAFKGFVGKLKDVATALLDGVKAMAKYIAKLIVMAAKTAVAVAKLIAQKVATIAMTVAQGALNLIMSMNPITLIVIAITAVIAGLVLLYNKCEWFRDAVNSVFEAISGVVSGFIDILKGIWNTITDVISSVIDFVKNNWQGLLLILVNPFVGAFKLIYDNCEGFREIVDNVVESIKDFFSGLWENIKSGASGAWEGIKNVFSSVGNFFKDTFTKAWTAVKNIFSTGGRIFDGIKDGIVNAFKSIVNALISGINRIISTPFNAINNMLNTIRNINILGNKPFKGLWSQNPLKVPQIPKLKTGTNDIESEGLYHLHEGEAVVPKKYNPATGGYNDGSDNKQIIDLLVSLNANMLAFSEKPMNIYADATKIAEATYEPLQQVGKNKNISNVMQRS